MKTFVHRSLAALAAVACIALGSVVLADAPKVGAAPPEIKAAGYINGADGLSLASLKGKVVVVEFWATWCPPCRKSIPHLIELHEKHKDKGLTIIGLSDEGKDVVAPFAEKMKMTYVVGFGSQSGGDYGVKGIPTAFVVGADGKLVWSGHPMQGDFEKAIEEALAKAKG